VQCFLMQENFKQAAVALGHAAVFKFSAEAVPCFIALVK